jgi:hypothetical protein
MKLRAAAPLLISLGSVAACATLGDDSNEEAVAAADQLATVSCPSTVDAGARPKADALRDLMKLATGSTKSSVTPMGVHYEALSKVPLTAANQAFLRDPKKSPPIPKSTSGLHLKAFPVTLYPSGCGPVPSDINQHAIGDCNGLTAMASMAYVAQSFVPGLIKDNKDNTFTVAMYDPKGRPVSVSVDNQFLADSNDNIAAVSGKNGVATWATVLEKAVMKYISVFKVVNDIGGIGSEFVTPMFTGAGDSFAFDRGKLTGEQIKRVVKASLAAGKFISGGFGSVMTLGSDKTVTAHAYGVFLSTKGDAITAMRNPWGVNPTTKNDYNTATDGVLDIPNKPEWVKTIDLRIIAPGAAAKSAGVWTAYVPPAPVQSLMAIGDGPTAPLPFEGPGLQVPEDPESAPVDTGEEDVGGPLPPVDGPGQSAEIDDDGLPE